MHIRIVTRKSKLALWQAEDVAKKLQEAGATTELIPIETKGDKVLDVTIAKIGSKGVFTEELEEMLAEKKADIAVHSAKDLQSALPQGFLLLSLTAREQAHDVLISYKKVNLDEPLTVGTSSTRRVAMLRHYYPHFRTTSVRGNLQTRIRKMEEGACDALMLAYAGVHRMALDHLIRFEFPVDIFTPPVGQASIGIECHDQLDPDKKDFIINALNHAETALCIGAERAFLKKLEGGCSIPSFALARLHDVNITLTCGLIGLDGQLIIRKTGTSTFEQGEKLGKDLATELLRDGGEELLLEIKSNQNE